jgi:hypothetical protein
MRVTLADGILTLGVCLTLAPEASEAYAPAVGEAMKVCVIAVVVAACLVSAAVAPASADRRSEHRRSEFQGSRRFDRHSHPGFHHRGPFPIFVVPSIYGLPDAEPTTGYAAPAPSYAPPVTYAPYAPPPAYGVPTQRIIEFATGRYELRGDGMYTPYTWVWIPNPPLAPPDLAPPIAPPPPPSSAPEPPRRPASHPAKVYRWTDEHGVTTWTDDLEKVPARYRAQAGRLTP